MTVMTRLGVSCSFAVMLSGHVMAQGIYTCVDAKGRKITSDRPIAECMDRVQKEITATGTVKRVLAPPPNAQERVALEAKEKLDAEEHSKAAEQRVRDRTLFNRYPDRASHDKVRTATLEPVNVIVKTATQRSEDLAAQRKGIMTELEFYKNSPGKVPPALKRRLDETDGHIATQKRLLADQEAEKKRITERFNSEATKLKPRWDAVGTSSVAAAVPDSTKKP